MLLLHRGDGFDPNFHYHCGFEVDNSFLLVDGKKKTLFVSKLNASLAHARFRGEVVVFDDVVSALSKRIKGRKVFFDGTSMSARMAERIGKLCRLSDYSEELLRMRLKKKPAEVSDIRRAVRHTKDIFAELDFGKAKTELGVKKQLLLATLELGLEPAFDPIVSTGGNTSYPHYEPAERKLDSLVMVDYGVRYKHYCADITRCFILDGDAKKKKQYESLRSVFDSLVDALPELRTGNEVAKLSDRLIEREKFPKLFHAIGHGIGLAVHEYPRLNLRHRDPLAGSVCAIEPAFYLHGYGMRYEDVVYLSRGKARRL